MLPSVSRRCPTTKRRDMMSFGKKRVSFRPTGSRTRSLTARSYVDPVTFSMIRPARLSAGVVVRDDESRRRQLLEDGHALDEARQRVIAVAGVLEEVAIPAGRVVEQLKDRHALGDLGIAERQLRNVRAHRRVEVDLALLDQPQEGDRCVRLPGRAELEERVLVDWQRVLDAGHAVVGVALLVIVEDADGHPGNLEFLGQLADLGVQALVDSLIVPAYPLSRCPSTIGTRGITRWTSWSCD